MIIRLSDRPDRTEDRNPIVMRRLVDAEQTEAMSMTWIQIWGRHVRLRTDEAERTYVILAGNGRFQLGDAPFEDVAAGDVVFIPVATPYEFEGYFTYLVINTPGFRDGSDVFLE